MEQKIVDERSVALNLSYLRNNISSTVTRGAWLTPDRLLGLTAETSERVGEPEVGLSVQKRQEGARSESSDLGILRRQPAVTTAVPYGCDDVAL
eukprot:scaffold128501_cov34-Prasinocladus_malaysianus.AAC.1